MLSNPPFGEDWKNIREAIEAEYARAAAMLSIVKQDLLAT